jgi:hypothetical protein
MGDYSKGYIIESGDDENNQLSNKLQTTNIMTKPSQSISKPSQPSQFSSNNSSQTELEEFKRYYIPYNGYNATDTCNPVTARLIIFYNDKLVPFLKKYYVQSTQRPESPTNYSITQVFIFFFQLIFYQNFYKYNDNEKTWLANQVSMIENNIIKNFDTLNLFKEGTKFADVLDFINKNNKNETNPVNNYIYTTVNELFSDQSLSDPIKKLFLNFMEIINKYYKPYYDNYFNVFYEYFNGTTPLQENDKNIPPILIDIDNYDKPVGKNVLELLKNYSKDCYNENVESSSTLELIQNQFPELESLIKTFCNAENRGDDTPEPETTWDEIFEHSGYLQENVNASGQPSSPLQQQQQQPARQQPQPTNDNFTPGEIVYGKAYDGSWVQVRITSVDNSARNANLEVVANTNLKPTNIPFDRLSKTDPSYPSNSMGGKLTFSNKMKNRTKSLKVFKKKSIKKQNRSLKKLV